MAKVKARTKGQKRGRPRKEGPRVPGSDRLSRVNRERQQDAQRQVSLARCRIMGWDYTPENQKRALADHLGCNAGRAIDGERDRTELWAAVKLIITTYTRYWLSIGAPQPYAKAAMLTYLPEILGSDGVEASTWDDRTEEQKVKGAAAAMMRIEQALGSAGYGVAAEVKGVVLQDAPVRDYGKLIAGLRSVG